MADAVVSAVLRSVLGILTSTAVGEIGLLWGFKGELCKLQSIVETIQLVVQEAEVKARKSPALHNWLKKLKEAAFDVEDILDCISTEALRQEADSRRGIQSQLNSFFSVKKNPLAFKIQMAHKMKSIRKKLEAIAVERHMFHLSEGVAQNQFGVEESRHTTSVVNESVIFGRGEEKEMIIEKILDDEVKNSDDIFVFAIHGMGGLGKTTLAKMIHNDTRIERCFHLRIWISVSDDFSIRKILKSILESIDGASSNIYQLDTLQKNVQQKLRGKRFFLVFDDISNENPCIWDELKQILRSGVNGSMIIVTTRNEKVARIMDPIAIHCINYLSEEDSWNMFKYRAFPNFEGKENFIGIGRQIVKKCIALGSTLRFKFDEAGWLAVKKAECWVMEDNTNGILPVLRLSYDNLIPELKQCFTFLAIFPKNTVLKENELIQLWMANNFIPCDSQEDMLSIIEQLVWRSFLQLDNVRGKKGYRMHGLMHDLASSLMKNEIQIIHESKGNAIRKKVRHLSICLSFRSSMNNAPSMFNLPIGSLRSIIVCGLDKFSQMSFPLFLSKQQNLRAFDVSLHSINNLSRIVCNLEHLKQH